MRGDKNKHQNHDKDFKNRRYWKNEQAIMKALSDAEDLPSVKDLVSTTGISRSTFYRHHRGVHRIVPDLEKRVLLDFSHQISKKQDNKGVKAPVLFYKLLSCVRKNRRTLQLILRYGDGRIVDKMMSSFLPRIVKNYKLPSKNTEAIHIYEKEIVAVIETWISDGFRVNELKVLNDIMYLTRTARKRLSALEG